MARFHLNPTISQECRNCGHEVVFFLVAGEQAGQCTRCKTVMKAQLPDSWLKVQELCTQFEATVDKKLSAEVGD